MEAKNILITAPENYACKFSKLLQEKEAIVWHFPAVTTQINRNLSALQTYISNLQAGDLIMLPSRMAIDAFFKAYNDLRTKPDLKTVHFFAFGHDQFYLEEKYHFQVASKSLLNGPKDIISYFEKHSYTDKKIWVVVPKVIGVPEPNVIPDFIKGLKTIGLQPVRIEGYITQANKMNFYPEIKKALTQGQIDLIAFTSTAEIMALLKEMPLSKLQNVKVACFGPYTGNNAIKLGLKPVYIGKKHTAFTDFVEGISELFQ